MSRLVTIGIAMLLLAGGARGALVLHNGSFDLDQPLGGVDDPVTAPTGWYQHYSEDQSWSDFRFGNVGNGGWNNNGITLGQNYLGPDFTPGPEDGYYYTSVGTYGGEVSATVRGSGYNRSGRPNPAGDFYVQLYSTKPGAFTAADGNDVAATGVGTLLGELKVDISSLTGTTPLSQAFQLTVPFAGTGIAPGDTVWLRFWDGPDNGNLDTFDEPTIDNVTLTSVVPEPGALGLLLLAAIPLIRRTTRR
jgi:MYXO-CTERM domain-containing protein